MSISDLVLYSWKESHFARVRICIWISYIWYIHNCNIHNCATLFFLPHWLILTIATLQPAGILKLHFHTLQQVAIVNPLCGRERKSPWVMLWFWSQHDSGVVSDLQHRKSSDSAPFLFCCTLRLEESVIEYKNGRENQFIILIYNVINGEVFPFISNSWINLN